MIRSPEFISAAYHRGFKFYTGVPCSHLKSFINCVIDSPKLRYVAATNEGDAVAIASGVELAGQRSVVMLQNSGLGNAVNPLTSLNAIFKIPILLIVTWRGQPNQNPDQPQHQLMGKITPNLLDLMQIPWEYFPTATAQIEPTLNRVVQQITENRTPYALIMQQGSVESASLSSQLAIKPPSLISNLSYHSSTAKFSRHDILKAIQAVIQPPDILLATTGYTGRELSAIEDRENQFYLVGSMGCVASIGLGIALTQPQRQVTVIDGDGAALMRLGAFPTIGYERPANLTHILLDNHCHESTGGQSTVSGSVNFGAIASASGYEKVILATTPEEVKFALQSASQQLTFIHVKIQPGTPQKLPRPKISPEIVAQRLRQLMRS
ncbi:MAG: phosphonopyruvate decarboxylase [Oscillatoria sp. PMC 1051.18]|nr:phosphonopyruvate decarboxylase [Oscillatoria sp. PMC 1050.18]MEC5032373.1 phosphonopyruvate decarboxylase [Oscillatoria sp. PMC 1051.18]